jgi:ribosome-binding protein aMBF1 (putative translation factor)
MSTRNRNRSKRAGAGGGARSASVGGRIHRLRLEAGLSQRDLAEPGISYAYISRIEAGQREPSAKALRKLAAKLSTTPLYLETGRHNATCPYCGRSDPGEQPPG